jgi:hypothetical protein
MLGQAAIEKLLGHRRRRRRRALEEKRRSSLLWLEARQPTTLELRYEGDGRCCEDEEGGWRGEGHFQIKAAVCRSLPSAAAEVVVLQQLQSSVIHCIPILMRTWCRRCAVLIQ